MVGASAKRHFRFSLYAAALLISVVILSNDGRADEALVVNITVNTVSKGDFFVFRNPQGEFFVKVADSPTLGIQLPADIAVVEIEKERHTALSSLRSVAVVFDERKLTLDITAPVGLLQKTTMDLSSVPPSPHGVYLPKESSAFLNYAVNYSYRNPDGSKAFAVVNKLGARSGDFFLITDSQYTQTEQASDFVRLMSSITYERPKALQWITLGDMFATSGNLGSTISIGGFGIKKAYQMDPSLIRQPTLNFTGAAMLPSQVDIYVDGVLAGRQRIQPGPFELNNLNYYGGMRNVDLIVKDAFGMEQRFRYPTYFTNALLKRGLHEYSYNIGLLREQYGIKSNDYGKPAFSAFHRFGATNAWTIGAGGEAADGIYNGSVQSSYLIPRSGVVTLELAASQSSIGSGWAGAFSYSYQKGRFGGSLSLAKYSPDYATIGGGLLFQKIDYATAIGASYHTEKWGALSLGYSQQNYYDTGDRKVTSATYSYNLTRSLTLGITTQAVKEGSADTDYQVFVSLNFYSDKGIQASAQHQSTRDGNAETVQLRKNQPTGEGWGYNAVATRNAGNSSGSMYSISPSVQYNGRYGIYSLDSYFQLGDIIKTDTHNLGAAGAVVYAGGFFGLTRPVNDSFGFVMVDKLPGVPLKVNNEEIGKTDASGRLIIPTMRSYNVNQLDLTPANIPIDYSISGVNVNVLPLLWSGSCIAFDVSRVQAVTGSILIKQQGKIIPLEFYDVTMIVNGKAFKFPTGRGGEFYFDTVGKTADKNPSAQQQGCRAIREKTSNADKIDVPGTYRASFDYEGKIHSFSMVIPPSSDAIIDVGKIVYELQ
jgi:outer membrane usher protein FimD/PapC